MAKTPAEQGEGTELWRLTDEEFERWLKKHNIRGVAAAAAGAKRRAQLRARATEDLA